MGNQQTSCCCSNEVGALPASFDMISPQLPQALFLQQLQLAPAELGGPEEAALVSAGKLANAHGSDNALRAQLLTAARQDDAPGVLQYVADGADIDDMGEALRLAAQRGSASVVRELVAVGLSVNECCPHSGFTPLQLSSASGHLTVCELLLDALADVHKSIGGTTALNLARKMGNIEVEEVLERHVASLVMDNDGEGGGEDAAQWSRRAHVLPRVSPVLSEAVLQALPSAPSQAPEGSAASPSRKGPTSSPADAASPPSEQAASPATESDENTPAHSPANNNGSSPAP